MVSAKTVCHNLSPESNVILISMTYTVARHQYRKKDESTKYAMSNPLTKRQNVNNTQIRTIVKVVH